MAGTVVMVGEDVGIRSTEGVRIEVGSAFFSSRCDRDCSRGCPWTVCRFGDVEASDERQEAKVRLLFLIK